MSSLLPPSYMHAFCLSSTSLFTRHLVMALTAITVFMGLPSNANSFPSEGHLWGGAGVANVNHAAPTAAGWWGPSVQTGVVLNINDFWRLSADAGASHHFRQTIDDEEAGPHTVVSTAVGARYALDVITYVPYVGLSAGFHPMGAPSSAAPGGELFSLRATLGLDYRASREFSFGAAADLHAPLTQPADFPHYSAIRLHIGYHFRRF